MTANVKHFLELQNKITNQLNHYGEVDLEIVSQYNDIGDHLTDSEIQEIYLEGEGDEYVIQDPWM